MSTRSNVVKLMQFGGLEAYGFYWVVMETLAREGGFLRYNDDTAIAIAWQCHIDTKHCHKMLLALLSCDLLQKDGDLIKSDQLNDSLNSMAERRLKRSEAGKLGAKKRWQKNQGVNSKAMAKDSGAKALPSDGNGSATTENSTYIHTNIHTDTNIHKASPFQYNDFNVAFDDGKEIENHTWFVNLGCRPLIDFPNVWLTTVQLKDLFSIWNKKGLKSAWSVLSKVNSQAAIVEKQSKGKFYNSFSAASGWALGAVLDDEANDSKREDRKGGKVKTFEQQHEDEFNKNIHALMNKPD